MTSVGLFYCSSTCLGERVKDTGGQHGRLDYDTVARMISVTNAGLSTVVELETSGDQHPTTCPINKLPTAHRLNR